MDKELILNGQQEKLKKLPIQATITIDRKIYSIGDIIYGTASFVNKSKSRVHIDTISLTLIGEFNLYETMFINHLKLKPFLKMYDTSLRITSIPPFGHINHEFMFKIPNYLLETQCPHGFSEHLCLSSSLKKLGKRLSPTEQINYSIELKLGFPQGVTSIKKSLQIETSAIDFNIFKTTESTFSQIGRITSMITKEINILSDQDVGKEPIIEPVVSNEEKASHFAETYIQEDAQSLRTLTNIPMITEFVIFSDKINGELVLIIDASIITIDSPLPLEFKYKPPANKSWFMVPEIVSLKPKLRVFNYQSKTKIPLVFDKEFLFDGGFNPFQLGSLRVKFSTFRYHLKRLSGSSLETCPYTKFLINSSLSIENLTAQRDTLDILDKHEISLGFCREEDTGWFTCKKVITLSKDPGKSLAQPFQMCQMGRLYMVELEIHLRKPFKSKKVCYLCPITVI